MKHIHTAVAGEIGEIKESWLFIGVAAEQKGSFYRLSALGIT
jgi:hypothetical protein